MKNINVWGFFISVLIIVYWITFIDKIGLHGDEAYFGLDAIDFLNNGMSRPYGMNKYTGVLQTLLNLYFFRTIGIKVVSLRIGGILCNIVSLCMTAILLKKRINDTAVFIFLLLVSQSILILTYSKIGWEVCSLNYLFMVLSLLSLQHVNGTGKIKRNAMSFIFLSSTIVGTYNHILFSSYIVATILGILMWVLFEKKSYTGISGYFSLFSLSLVNAIVLYVIMNFAIDLLWEKLKVLVFMLPVLLIIPELILLKKIQRGIESILQVLLRQDIKKPVQTIFLLLFILAFGIIHAKTLFQITSNRTVLLRVFSYEIPPVLRYFYSITTICLVVFIIVSFMKDLIKGSKHPWSYIFIAYLGIFNLYTVGNSIRYFLMLSIIMFLYLSIKLSFEQKKLRSAFIVLLAISAIFSQSTLWYLDLNSTRKVKATKFKISTHKKETSAHFLNFEPVINYAYKNKIGEVETKEKFFIGNVFEFYTDIFPELKNFKDTAKVNYDYKVDGTGFEIE